MTILGDLLGILLDVMANVGGVGIATILLRAARVRLMGGAMLRNFAIVATAFVVDVMEVDIIESRRAGLPGVGALARGTGVTKAGTVMVGTRLGARLIGLDNPRSAMAYGGPMGTVRDVAGVLAATDPRRVPDGALTASFHTGIGCRVGASLPFLIVRALVG